jgi:hypothetical protein
MSGAHPADVAAAKSTAARKSAAAKSTAAEVATATAKPAATKMAAASAEPAATTVTAAATTTSSEGVSPDRRHTEGDHRKHDTNFAQHGILHQGRDGVRFFCRYRRTAANADSDRITKGCSAPDASDLREIAVAIRLLRRSGWPVRRGPGTYSAGTG